MYCCSIISGVKAQITIPIQSSARIEMRSSKLITMYVLPLLARAHNDVLRGGGREEERMRHNQCKSIGHVKVQSLGVGP